MINNPEIKINKLPLELKKIIKGTRGYNKPSKSLSHQKNNLGCRNTNTFKYACLLAQQHIDLDIIKEVVNVYNTKMNKPPLSSREVSTICESALNYKDYSYNLRLGMYQPDSEKTISDKVVDILNSKVKAEMKSRQICELIIDYINKNGKFYKSSGNFYVFDNENKLLIWLDKGNRNLKRLIYQCGINPASDLYKHVFEALCAHCNINGIETEVYKFAHVDTTNYCIYIKNGENILKVTDNSVELCDNGTDKILFTDAVEVEKFECISDMSEDYLSKYLFDKPNYNGTSYLTPEELKTLTMIYFVSIYLHYSFFLFLQKKLLIYEK